MDILAIDPGGTTGVCMLRWDGSSREFEVVASHEYVWGDRFVLYTWVEAAKFDVVVIEQFTLYKHEALNQVGSTFPSSQVIGALEAVLFNTHQLSKRVFQPAYNTKAVKVNAEHTLSIGSSEHRKDAYKHAKYFIAASRQPLAKTGVVALGAVPVSSHRRSQGSRDS
jgi:hypothetical protein